MYGIGQRVVHPMHGAGVIENVTEELLYGAARTYYVFRQAVSGLVLKLPADNCEAIGVRLLYDRERMDAVLSAIPSLTVEEERNWNRPGVLLSVLCRAGDRENMARLKSGDLTEVARVVKSLMRREAARGLSTGERKMLHSAKEILLSELAMVREIGYQEAERLLDGAVMTGACE